MIEMLPDTISVDELALLEIRSNSNPKNTRCLGGSSKHKVEIDGQLVKAGRLISQGKKGFKCSKCGKVFDGQRWR